MCVEMRYLHLLPSAAVECVCVSLLAAAITAAVECVCVWRGELETESQ